MCIRDRDYTVNPIEGLELSDQLHDAVKYIHGTYQEAELPELGEGEAIDTSIPADPNVKNYSYAIVAVSYTHLDCCSLSESGGRCRPCGADGRWKTQRGDACGMQLFNKM